MDSSAVTVSWSNTLLRIDTIVAEFAPSLELPLKVFRTCLPPITIAGLGVIIWWRGRRDQGQMRRHVEVTIEMVGHSCLLILVQDLPTDATAQPTLYTLLCVLGYLTAALVVLDVRILTLLLPLALASTCNLRLSTPKPTDDGYGPTIAETTPPKTTSGKFSSISRTPGTVSQPRIRVAP